jgi:hypothetical protein
MQMLRFSVVWNWVKKKKPRWYRSRKNENWMGIMQWNYVITYSKDVRTGHETSNVDGMNGEMLFYDDGTKEE